MDKCPECGFMAETLTELSTHWLEAGHIAPPAPAPPELVINQILPNVSPEDSAQVRFRDKEVKHIEPPGEDGLEIWVIHYKDGSSRWVERRPWSDSDGSEPKEVEQLRQRVKGFTVSCNHCGSRNVRLRNTLDYHPGDGNWGAVTLECQDCDDEIELLNGIYDRR